MAHTVLSPQAVPDPYIVRIFRGEYTYYYGVFATRKDAIEWGVRMAHDGTTFKAERLLLVEDNR